MINLYEVRQLDQHKLWQLVDHTSLKNRVGDRRELSTRTLLLTKPALTYLADQLDAEKIFYSDGKNAYRYYITKDSFKKLVKMLIKLKSEQEQIEVN